MVIRDRSMFGKCQSLNVGLGLAQQHLNYSAKLQPNFKKIWRHFCGSAFATFCVSLKSLYFIVTVVYLLLVTS